LFAQFFGAFSDSPEHLLPGAAEIALGDLTDPVSVAEAIKGVD
jgi:uncharacterized protein YbjT (DUF2867 family)